MVINVKLLKDIGIFLKTLSFVDYIFFLAILVLMILIVTLIYFIRINEDVIDEDNDLEETREMSIVKELKKSMAENDDVVRINLSHYEQDQEDKAIISYDELLNKSSNNYEFNYEKEDYYDDLSVKKFNLDNLINKNATNHSPKVEGRVISFAKEEAFLQALKQLQKELG